MCSKRGHNDAKTETNRGPKHDRKQMYRDTTELPTPDDPDLAPPKRLRRPLSAARTRKCAPVTRSRRVTGTLGSSGWTPESVSEHLAARICMYFHIPQFDTTKLHTPDPTSFHCMNLMVSDHPMDNYKSSVPTAGSGAFPRTCHAHPNGGK